MRSSLAKSKGSKKRLFASCAADRRRRDARLCNSFSTADRNFSSSPMICGASLGRLAEPAVLALPSPAARQTWPGLDASYARLWDTRLRPPKASATAQGLHTKFHCQNPSLVSVSRESISQLGLFGRSARTVRRAVRASGKCLALKNTSSLSEAFSVKKSLKSLRRIANRACALAF